jgi:hypothetical protein
MAIWYVRPSAAHGGTNAGTSYANAWQGWAAIVWGGAGVVGGDTLVVAGAVSSATTLAVGAHGATLGNEVTIRGDHPGDPGSISITVAGQFFGGTTRSHTYFVAMTFTGVSRAVYWDGVLANCKFTSCTFNGGTNTTLAFAGTNSSAYSDIGIIDCVFNGGQSAAENAGGAISWFVATAAAVSTMARLTITGNTFNNINAAGTARAVIHLRTEAAASVSSVLSDVRIERNTFQTFRGNAIEAFDGHTTFGVFRGIRILDNDIQDGTEGFSNIGGGIVLGGIGNSTTAGFGRNDIARNKIHRIVGATGAFNLFYGQYYVWRNDVDTVSTTTIDGNGLLFDHGCNFSAAWNNEFRNIVGKAGVFNSGVGIMVLDATNCKAYGNTFDNVLCAILLGTAGAGQSCTIVTNTFTRVQVYGVYAGANADLPNCGVRNNIVQGSGHSVYDLTATAWTAETRNCFHGFASGTLNHTLGAGTITTDPQLGTDYSIPATSPCKGTGVYIPGAKHYGGHSMSVVSPDIGARRYFAPRAIAEDRPVRMVA